MYRFNGFTQKANHAMNLAIQCAEEMGHTYVGSEHILLGLLKEGSGVAAAVLRAVEVDASQLELLMTRMEISALDRPVVAAALRKAEETDAPAVALELPSGEIVTGKTSS